MGRGRVMVEEESASDGYNLSLQIGGIFIIIATSFVGMGLAYVMDYVKKRMKGAESSWVRGLDVSLDCLRGIGVGVIISTALIHLIGEAYEPFEDSGLAESYEQWPMVFAMIGMFLMSVVEFFHHRVEAKSQPEGRVDKPVDPAEYELEDKGLGGSTEDGAGPPGSGFSKNQRNAILVEASILIHSILIGFDLGLQPEQQWVPLVTAISFHQFFEGFAVGQIILDAKFGLMKKCLMTFFYSITTAVGIAIGIGTYLGQNYEGQSRGANITIGVLDSLCGGFLLFMGMSIIWVEWFINNKDLHHSDSLLSPIFGFTGVAFGMAIMAIIGIWA